MTGNDSNSTLPAAAHCLTCDAVLRPGADRCWLCYAAVTGIGRGESVESSPPRPAPSADVLPTGGFSLASMLMFVTLVSVVLGLSTIAPGVGIPLGLILLVIWLRTAAVARRRRQRGIVVTRADMVEAFLGSLGVAVILLTVTCVAGCAAFFAACFSCAAAMNVGGEGLGPVVFAIVAALITIPVLIWMGKLIRRRWRRDIGEPD